jgi:hypothetical protein
MDFTSQMCNINPMSDELPSYNPLGGRISYMEEPEDGFLSNILLSRLLAGGNRICGRSYIPRAQKRDCVNCGLRHSSFSQKKTAYCNHCKYASSSILSWYKRRVIQRRLYNSILVLNLMSRSMYTGDIGILDNIMSFL